MSHTGQLLEKCCVGKTNKTECHKYDFSEVSQLVNVQSLSELDQKLLCLRSGVSAKHLITVCEHHKNFYLKKYESFQTFCCDPFSSHKNKIKKSLRPVTLAYSESLRRLSGISHPKPGQQICSSCRENLRTQLLHPLGLRAPQEEGGSKANLQPEQADQENDNLLQLKQSDQKKLQPKHYEPVPTCSTGLESSFDVSDSASNENSQQSQKPADYISEGSQDYQTELKEEEKRRSLELVNAALQSIGESPISLHSVSEHSRVPYAVEKLDSAFQKLESLVSTVLGENIRDKVSSSSTKANDLDELIALMKSKLNLNLTRREKIQILTLAPESWSRKRVRDEFQVSDYLVRQARRLVKEKGILALPDQKRGKKLSQNIIDAVIQFYENEKYTRELPGMNDKVSVAKNVYKQKKLLLGNLNELYASFKKDNPLMKISFSKFCALRPKWCILAGASGTHNVCVCEIHQNVKLLLDASPMDKTYKDLIKFMVCSDKERDCMLRHCSNCPGPENLKSFLLTQFADMDLNDEIEYNAWTSTDRTTQLTHRTTLEEYLDILVASIEKLIPHSFIASSQRDFLKEKKANLKEDEAIVLLDFSQNYSFVTQNEIQSNYWSREYCSLQPVVIYTQGTTPDKPTVTSLCACSDDLDHDVPFVHATQKFVTEYIKQKFPLVKKIMYFSDGCGGQYKNYKNFLNLCHHETDFQIKATWGFYATSHGKSACDGIGGSLKRLVTKGSLQLQDGTLINSAQKFVEFCQRENKFEKIECFLLKKEDLAEYRQQLEIRFSQGGTVPGTRSFHHFYPQSTNIIAAKRISYDDTNSIVHNFSDQPLAAIQMSNITTNTYVACVYDNHWFFGLVLSKDEAEGDVEVTFMHPEGDSAVSSFFWPSIREDKCFVPISNIISKVTSPTTSASGRQYYFTQDDMEKVRNEYCIHFQ